MRKQLVEILTVLTLNDLVKSGKLKDCDAPTVDIAVQHHYETLWEEMNYLFQTPGEVWAEINRTVADILSLADASYPERLKARELGAAGNRPARTTPAFTLLR